MAAFEESKNGATAPEHDAHNGHVAKKNPPSVISNQLRDELIRILRTGDDRNEGAFTIAVAAQVEKFVAAAREILMTENLAQNDLGSLMRMRKHPHWVGFGSNPLPTLSSGGVDDYIPPINNENFGVQAIRQIVDGFKTTNEAPAKLVEALVVARSNNLADVAAALEKKLGVSKAAAAFEGEVLKEHVL
jgi:hypothetical protein